MKAEPIVIQKLRLDVFTDEVQAPESLLEEAMEQLRERVLPLLEERLRVVGEKGHFLLDKLEIEQRVDAGDDWPLQVADALARELIPAMKGKETDNTAETTETPAERDERPKVRQVADLSRLVAAWLHFLQQGRLPWWVAGLGVRRLVEPEEGGLLGLTRAFGPEKVWAAPELMAVWAEHPFAARRLAAHLSENDLHLLLRSLVPAAGPLLNILSSYPSHTSARATRWPSVLRAIPELRPLAGAAPASWLLPVLRQVRTPEEADCWDGPVAGTGLEMVWEELKERITPRNVVQGPWTPPVLPPGESRPDAPSPDVLSPGARSALQSGVAEAEMYPEYAGLVLLHVFLPSFFQNLGLTDSRDQWTDPDAPTLAVHLLGYLARGNWTAGEDELAIPKLLAGLPLEWVVLPLDEAPEIAERVERETDSLLQVIHTHWPPMRSCTWEGLAIDFLQRPGKLSRTEAGHWTLQMESRLTDVLLRRLGWGLSPVKLPWMEGMVMVEWG